MDSAVWVPTSAGTTGRWSLRILAQSRRANQFDVEQADASQHMAAEPKRLEARGRRRPGSGKPVECRGQGLAHEFTEIQHLAAVRDVGEQHVDKGMLAVERVASLVFRADNPLKRGKIPSSKPIVLVTEQTLTSSTVLDGLDPDVHHLAADERLDLDRAVLGEKP